MVKITISNLKKLNVAKYEKNECYKTYIPIFYYICLSY